MSLTLAVGALFFSAGAANAGTCTAYPSGCSTPAVTIAPSTPKPYTDPVAVASTSSGSLAFTGTDVVGTLVAGVVLIGAGAVVVGASRRRRSADRP